MLRSASGVDRVGLKSPELLGRAAPSGKVIQALGAEAGPVAPGEAGVREQSEKTRPLPACGSSRVESKMGCPLEAIWRREGTSNPRGSVPFFKKHPPAPGGRWDHRQVSEERCRQASRPL
ncbi:uncharacterized protein LOC144321162 [Canis aureus]